MKKVREVMNKDVVYFSPDDSIFEVAKILAELDISGGPVVEKGKVVGVITLSDILRYISIKTSIEPKIINPSLSELILRLLELGKNQLEFKKEMEKIKSFKVKDVMTKKVITIHPDADLIEAATLLEKHKINRLPVVDKKGRLKGIIARADLVKAIVMED
ncbi:MAG: CBS domain-containing protein [Candidatus Aenigmarchaeota archaeon]|nr:CBS domain-containing protein [Candidatus Aenigmarchaeota archaeon]